MALGVITAPVAIADSPVESDSEELSTTTAVKPGDHSVSEFDALAMAEGKKVIQSNTPLTIHPYAFTAQGQAIASAAQTSPMRAVAPPPILVAEMNNSPMGQVNNVFELRDISPTDWAYAALRDLVNRYGCIKGYPDGTFRGNRALSRYEFAAALNACMQVIEQSLAQIGDRFATQQDLEALGRLVQEFEAELANLTTQVDDIEERVQTLEDNQFSTTTKLFGQVTMGVQGRTRGGFSIAGSRFDDTENEINVIHSTNLSLFTQFSPRSLLLTTFNAGVGRTTNRFTDTLANYIGLAYEGGDNNRLQLSDLNYRHLFGTNFAVMVGPQGISPVNVFRGTNRIESQGSGPLSRFAQRNPIMSIGGGRAGVGIDWQINPDMSFQAVYASQLPADPRNGGLFGGENNSTTLGAQVVVSPSRNIDLSLQYINAYTPFGRLLTGVGDDQLILGNTSTVFNLRAPMQTNALGFGAEFRPSERITLGGWAGYTFSNYIVADGGVETFNWMTFLNFPDLGGDGNLLGLYFGQPPRITRSTMPDAATGDQARNLASFLGRGDILNADPGGQQGATYHVEAFYRWQLSQNISITPGLVWVISPFHIGSNDNILIGALRTTFSF
ncbi:MAG: porin [Spirulina sp. DLM2.Bin59]|nr:MAG: porin [Spirulina sp. DLM2.Bin59]